MAAPNTTYVSTGKPKVGGAVYIADTTATMPTDAKAELGTGWTSLGYISEDGVTNENSPETDTAKAWGGDIVLTLQSEKSDNFTFTLIGTLDVDVLKAVFGDNNVTGTLETGITINSTTEQLDAKAWVFEVMMREGAMKRILIPHGEITEIGEIVYKDDEAAGYEITIAAMPDSNSVTHKEFILRA